MYIATMQTMSKHSRRRTRDSWSSTILFKIFATKMVLQENQRQFYQTNVLIIKSWKTVFYFSRTQINQNLLHLAKPNFDMCRMSAGFFRISLKRFLAVCVGVHVFKIIWSSIWKPTFWCFVSGNLTWGCHLIIGYSIY